MIFSIALKTSLWLLAEYSITCRSIISLPLTYPHSINIISVIYGTRRQSIYGSAAAARTTSDEGSA